MRQPNGVHFAARHNDTMVMKEILLIILVSLAAIVYTRYQGSKPAARSRPMVDVPARPSRLPMLVAGGLVLITLVISGVMYYLHWQDAHRIYTVQVINTHTNELRHYQVYRDGIDGRSFRTTDGRLISLSSTERMEVVEGVLAE